MTPSQLSPTVETLESDGPSRAIADSNTALGIHGANRFAHLRITNPESASKLLNAERPVGPALEMRPSEKEVVKRALPDIELEPRSQLVFDISNRIVKAHAEHPTPPNIN